MSPTLTAREPEKETFPEKKRPGFPGPNSLSVLRAVEAKAGVKPILTRPYFLWTFAVVLNIFTYIIMPYLYMITGQRHCASFPLFPR
jgi:hypothetical protein